MHYFKHYLFAYYFISIQGRVMSEETFKSFLLHERVACPGNDIAL